MTSLENMQRAFKHWKVENRLFLDYAETDRKYRYLFL